jgi:hypothetical protein
MKTWIAAALGAALIAGPALAQSSRPQPGGTGTAQPSMSGGNNMGGGVGGQQQGGGMSGDSTVLGGGTTNNRPTLGGGNTGAQSPGSTGPVPRPTPQGSSTGR